MSNHKGKENYPSEDGELYQSERTHTKVSNIRICICKGKNGKSLLSSRSITDVSHACSVWAKLILNKYQMHLYLWVHAVCMLWKFFCNQKDEKKTHKKYSVQQQVFLFDPEERKRCAHHACVSLFSSIYIEIVRFRAINIYGIANQKQLLPNIWMLSVYWFYCLWVECMECHYRCACISTTISVQSLPTPLDAHHSVMLFINTNYYRTMYILGWKSLVCTEKSIRIGGYQKAEGGAQFILIFERGLYWAPHQIDIVLYKRLNGPGDKGFVWQTTTICNVFCIQPKWSVAKATDQPIERDVKLNMYHGPLLWHIYYFKTGRTVHNCLLLWHISTGCWILLYGICERHLLSVVRYAREHMWRRSRAIHGNETNITGAAYFWVNFFFYSLFSDFILLIREPNLIEGMRGSLSVFMKYATQIDLVYATKPFIDLYWWWAHIFWWRFYSNDAEIMNITWSWCSNGSENKNTRRINIYWSINHSRNMTMNWSIFFLEAFKGEAELTKLHEFEKRSRHHILLLSLLTRCCLLVSVRRAYSVERQLQSTAHKTLENMMTKVLVVVLKPTYSSYTSIVEKIYQKFKKVECCWRIRISLPQVFSNPMKFKISRCKTIHILIEFQIRNKKKNTLTLSHVQL